MKINFFFTIFILFFAVNSVFSQNTYVPDDNFEQALIDLGYDSGPLNDSVPTANISSVLDLDVSNKNISDLTGIEDFTALINLNCIENQIDTLNLNDNTSLQILTCFNNQLTELKIENLTQLYYLHFTHNNIQSIDLSFNTKLTSLNCDLNNLSSLNLENLNSLNSLNCWGNGLTTLDLKNNTELTTLSCNDNQLSSLDISANIKLSSLSCNNNELKSLSINNGNNHNFTFFNSESNPDLYCIQVDNENVISGYSNWFKDEQASYSEDCSNFGAGVPLSEYNSLVELYYNSYEPDWINKTNWLDTITHSVADWYGITVENGHVTKIELPNNNLQEGIFENPVQLPVLEVLDLNGNKLMGANFNNLEGLLKLTAVHIENNNFVFKYIAPLQDLATYHNFSDNFTYSPQAKIDKMENITFKKGEVLEMSINPLWISTGDQFQWFKDGVALPGKINYYFDKADATLSDSGTYFLKITNPDVPDLTLQSNDKHVTILDLVSGVPRKEYEALVELFNSTKGDNWRYKTNWKDTTVNIDDWYGITVRNGHVTGIQLSNNYLEGAIPADLTELGKLNYLNLESNRIGRFSENPVERLENQIPDELGKLVELETLLLSNNYLEFNDLEPIFSWANYSGIRNFSYTGQNWIYKYVDKFVSTNTMGKVSLYNYFPGTSDDYIWFKDGVEITGENDSVLFIDNFEVEDEGNYSCLITNSVVPGLEIRYYATRLNLDGVHGSGVPLSEYLALEKLYKENNGDTWSVDDNWMDTISHTVGEWYGVTVSDGHVEQLALDSIDRINVIPDELINLQYLKGLYIWHQPISGNIPEFFGQFKNLEKLFITSTNFSGEIPSSLGQLTNLQILELSDNNLEGTLPKELVLC